MSWQMGHRNWLWDHDSDRLYTMKNLDNKCFFWLLPMYWPLSSREELNCFLLLTNRRGLLKFICNSFVLILFFSKYKRYLRVLIPGSWTDYAKYLQGIYQKNRYDRLLLLSSLEPAIPQWFLCRKTDLDSITSLSLSDDNCKFLKWVYVCKYSTCFEFPFPISHPLFLLSFSPSFPTHYTHIHKHTRTHTISGITLSLWCLTCLYRRSMHYAKYFRSISI